MIQDMIYRGTLKNTINAHLQDVTILLGSKSDMPVAEKCTKILEQFGVSTNYVLLVHIVHLLSSSKLFTMPKRMVVLYSLLWLV